MAVNITKGSGPAVDMSKHREKHVDLAKRFDKTGISLSKRGLDGIRAQVVLSLDHSISMTHLYRSGVVQVLVDRGLAFGLQVDVDGVIPVYAFDDVLHSEVKVGIEKGGMFSGVKAYSDVVDQHIWRESRMGGTRMAGMIRNATAIAKSSDAPVFHIIVGDGSPSDRAETTAAVIESSNYAVFHKFLAVAEVDYLRQLDDDLVGRSTVDNVDAKFFSDIRSVSDLSFSDDMVDEWPGWIHAAQQAGILQ